MIQLLMYFIDP